MPHMYVHSFKMGDLGQKRSTAVGDIRWTPYGKFPRRFGSVVTAAHTPATCTCRRSDSLFDQQIGRLEIQCFAACLREEHEENDDHVLAHCYLPILRLAMHAPSERAVTGAQLL